jgi:Putative DNA-binding domain
MKDGGGSGPHQREAVPEAMREAMPEAMREAMPEAMREAMPEAMREAMPETMREALPEAMPEALPEARREAMRQRLLLRAVWRDAPAASLQGWTRGIAAASGLAAYQANAGALAERALAGAYPTLAALVGPASFAALARHFWQQHAPLHGDLGLWGQALPAFVAASAQLADEPCLADCARLDWALHAATRAADAPPLSPALDLLASTEPRQLRLRLAPGAAVVPSRWPIVTVWQAHRHDHGNDHGNEHGNQDGDQHSADGDRFAAARQAFDEARAETAFVWRDERFVVHAQAIDSADAAFSNACIDGATLAGALDAAGAAFAFDRWLARALSSRWLLAVQPYTRAL